MIALENIIPLDTDLVANIIKNDKDKIFLHKSATSTSSFSTQKIHKKLARAFSMEGIADFGNPSSHEREVSAIQFSASGKMRSKKINRLLKIKSHWKSETNIVISPPIQDHDFSGLPLDYGVDLKRCNHRDWNNLPIGGLYRLDRKKSLSTGNLCSFELDMAPQMLGSLQENSKYNPNASSYGDLSMSVLPEVPKRTCAFLENCTTDDSYLIQQGKQLNDFQRWSDPIHDEVGDVEPQYDTLPAFESKRVYDSLSKVTGSAKVASHYVNCGIELQKGKITFNSSEIHIYDTPKPSVNSRDFSRSTTKDTSNIEAQHSAGNVNPSICSDRHMICSEEELFEDYVDMFHGGEVNAFTSEARTTLVTRPLPPLPRPPRLTGRPHSSLLVTTHPPLLQDRPWSSHLTDAPPALPPWPASLTKLYSTHFKPPLAPCNSLDGSCATKTQLPSSTSSPCLLLNHSQRNTDSLSENVFNEFPPIPPRTGLAMTFPPSMSSAWSHPCLYNTDVSTPCEVPVSSKYSSLSRFPLASHFLPLYFRHRHQRITMSYHGKEQNE